MKALRLKRGNQSDSSRGDSPDDGVTILEFALVAMIFLFFVIALFDFVRFLLVQGIMKSAVNRALSRAQVLANIDSDCLDSTTQATCVAQRQAAFQDILNAARSMPLNTLVTQEQSMGGMHYFIAGSLTAPAIEMILSKTNDYRAVLVDGKDTTTMQQSSNLSLLDSLGTAASKPTMKSVLQAEPIQISLNGRFRAVLPILPELPLQATAAGYREIRGVSSFPARVNCRGVEVPIGTTPDNSDCPCSSSPANPLIHVVNGGACICVNPSMTTVSDSGGNVINCTCPPPFQVQGTSCGCPSSVCSNGGTVNSSTCACQCPGNLQEIDGICGCLPPFVNVNSNCQCPIDDNCRNSGGNTNSTTCACTCPTDKPYNPATGRCECDPDIECNNGTINGSCSCQCDRGFQLSGGDSCVCNSPHQVENNYCVCPSNTPCGGGGWIDQGTCACVCPPGKTLQNGVCVCGSVTCNGGTVNSSCGCDCGPGFTNDNGTCRCDAPKQITNGACVCPSTPCGGGGSIDPVTCQCTCPPPKVLQNGVCGCVTNPSCTNGTPNSTCGCDCNSGFTNNNGSCVCDSPRVIEAGQCKCSSSVTCNNGNVNQSTCSCECTGPRILSGNSCVCNPALCVGGTLDPSNCACSCDHGQTLQGNECRCPGNQTIGTSGNCSCPAAGQIIVNGNCQCPPTQVIIAGNQCGCPPPQVMLADGTCFIPE